MVSMVSSKIFAVFVVFVACFNVLVADECPTPVADLCRDTWDFDWKLDNCTLLETDPLCNETVVVMQCNAYEIYKRETSISALNLAGASSAKKCTFLDKPQLYIPGYKSVFNVTVVCIQDFLPHCESFTVLLDILVYAIPLGIFMGILIILWAFESGDFLSVVSRIRQFVIDVCMGFFTCVMARNTIVPEGLA